MSLTFELYFGLSSLALSTVFWIMATRQGGEDTGLEVSSNSLRFGTPLALGGFGIILLSAYFSNIDLIPFIKAVAIMQRLPNG